ncbi:hypothetical protein OESDEN_07647, partial [Oesophagostomum dentatum]
MEKELAWLTKEENFRKTLLSRTTSFEQKVDEFQHIVVEKDELIATLRQELEKLQTSTITETLKREEMMVITDVEK